MNWVILFMVVMGIYYWGKYSSQCSRVHPRLGTRCQLKPGHHPNAHRDREGRGWR